MIHFRLVSSTAILVALASPARGTNEPLPRSDEAGLYRACGLNCLAIVGHLKGIDVKLPDLIRFLNPRENGDSSVADLESAAEAIGLDSVSARVDLEHLSGFPFPLIAHLRSKSPSSDSSHYIVVLGFSDRGVLTLDAPRPLSITPYDQFRRTWTGVVVAFPADPVARKLLLASLNVTPAWHRWGPAALAGLSIVLISAVGLMSRLQRHGAVSANPAISRASGLASAKVFSLFSIVLVLISMGCDKTPARSRLSLSSPSIDLGVQDVGETTFSIPVTNQGSLPLVISGARSSCSCTLAQIPEMPIKPGGSGALTGKISVRPGPGSAEVAIQSNDPEQANVKVHLAWFGKHVPTLSPAELTVSLRRNEASERVIELSYPGGGPESTLTYLGVEGLSTSSQLTLVSDDPAAIQANPILSRIPVAGRATFRLELTGAEEVGESAVAAVVRVRHRSIDYALPLTIRMSTHDGITASPERLLFTGSSLENIRSFERRVVVRANTPGTLVVESKPDFLEVAMVEDGPYNHVAISRVSPSIKSGVSRGELILRDSNGSRVIVAVFASFTP